MASKSVKFTKERGSRRTDSGVGSLSDQDSRGPTPERAFADYDNQRPNGAALQEAFVNMREERDRWRKKAKELDADLTDVKKNLKETEARWRALFDRNELLDHERESLVLEKKTLQADYDRLATDYDARQNDYELLRDELARAHRKIEKLGGSSPVMSGAMPSSPTEKKVRRSSSRKEKGRSADAERAAERAAEKADKAEKDKLKSRFERSDESDARSSSTTKSRRRRDSYIEPLGQSTPRPMPVPPSPTRHFSNYATAPMHETQFTTMREPVVGSVPRTPTIHPSVTYTYEPAGYYEDGNYHIHPLPPVKSSRDRR